MFIYVFLIKYGSKRCTVVLLPRYYHTSQFNVSKSSCPPNAEFYVQQLMGTLLFLQPWLRLTIFASWNCWVSSSGVLVTNIRIFTIRSAPLRLPHETPLRNDPTELVTLLSPANVFVLFPRKCDFWSFLGIMATWVCQRYFRERSTF